MRRTGQFGPPNVQTLKEKPASRGERRKGRAGAQKGEGTRGKEKGAPESARRRADCSLWGKRLLRSGRSTETSYTTKWKERRIRRGKPRPMPRPFSTRIRRKLPKSGGKFPIKRRNTKKISARWRDRRKVWERNRGIVTKARKKKPTGRQQKLDPSPFLIRTRKDARLDNEREKRRLIRWD